MRNPNRIPILLELFTRTTVQLSYLQNVVGIASKSDLRKFQAKWESKESEIEKLWLENPDSRMSQILIASNVLPNFSGSWFYMEDETFLQRYGIADKRSTQIWNKVDGDLPERGIPIKYVSNTDLKEAATLLGEDVPNYIQAELDHREVNNLKVIEENNPYYKLEID